MSKPTDRPANPPTIKWPTQSSTCLHRVSFQTDSEPPHVNHRQTGPSMYPQGMAGRLDPEGPGPLRVFLRTPEVTQGEMTETFVKRNPWASPLDDIWKFVKCVRLGAKQSEITLKQGPWGPLLAPGQGQKPQYGRGQDSGRQVFAYKSRRIATFTTTQPYHPAPLGWLWSAPGWLWSVLCQISQFHLQKGSCTVCANGLSMLES